MKRITNKVIFYLAMNWEESIRSLITFYGIIVALIVIPTVTGMEDWLHVLSLPARLHMAVFIASILLMVLLCIVVGHLIGLGVTRPLRAMVERHEARERERLRVLADNAGKIYEKYEL